MNTVFLPQLLVSKFPHPNIPTEFRSNTDVMLHMSVVAAAAVVVAAGTAEVQTVDAQKHAVQPVSELAVVPDVVSPRGKVQQGGC